MTLCTARKVLPRLLVPWRLLKTTGNYSPFIPYGRKSGSFSCSGTAPGIFIMESMIDHVARSLGMDVESVKRANLYTQGQVLLVLA